MSRSRRILNNVLDKKCGFSDDLKNKIIDRAVTFVKKQETVGQKEDWRKISEYRKSKEGTKDLKKDSTISHEEARPTSKSYHSSDTDEIFTQEDLKDAFDARDEILKNSADVKKGIKKSIPHKSIPHIFHNIYFTSKDNPKEIKDSDVEIIKNNVLKTMLAFPDREYILWTNDNNIQDNIRNIEGLRIENIYGISDNDLNSELSEKIVSEDFGMASDILRAVLIKKYGGTYLDLDYAIYNYSLLRDFINSYTLILGKDSLGKEYFGNAFIAASPNHSVLINYVNKIKNNLSMPDPKDKSNACVVEKWDGVPEYVKYPANDFSNVITKTGPTVLTIAFYKSLKDGDIISTDIGLNHGIIFHYPGIKGDKLVTIYDPVVGEQLSFIYLPENNINIDSGNQTSYYDITGIISSRTEDLVLGNDAYSGSWIPNDGTYWENIIYPTCDV